MVLRYRLDDLGWVQFEWLAQSLCKGHLGLAVESWGGSGDRGRDAYTEASLRFPDPLITESGPFVFQAKFVATANSINSDWRKALGRSIRREAALIAQRTQTGVWEPPRHYVLITNCPLDSDARQETQGLLKKTVGTAVSVHTIGASDLCDWLDQYGAIRQSFPQLLGLRDLEALLTSATNRELIAKSRLLVEQARDDSRVFVPTAAYEKALRILDQHRFVVLEGPPEMGKTAIASTVALVQLSLGWQALVCDSPDDLFRQFDHDVAQVFVADDAFGRTEYDVTRGKSWERQLDKALRTLDHNHWLVWTSRKNILERARQTLDLQGRAEGFPTPAQVLVDAGLLSRREKALILYRHAKAAQLDISQSDIIRQVAVSTVENPHFTPERIRRLVSQQLPELVNRTHGGALSIEIVRREVQEAIRNPTDRMRKSFGALPMPHKWLLVCLLEEERWPEVAHLQTLYEATCPIEIRQSFSTVLEELGESFVRILIGRVTWMHPSYRDLVIDELMGDPELRRTFLSNLSLEGVKLALSESGGAAGDRAFPFMVDQESWKRIADWIPQFVRTATVESCLELLEILFQAAQSAAGDHAQDIVTLLSRAAEMIRERWNEEEVVLTPSQIATFAMSTSSLSQLIPMPNLNPSWKRMDDWVHGSRTANDRLDANQLGDWSELLEVVSSTEPRLLKQKGFPGEYVTVLEAVLVGAEEELHYRVSGDEADELRTEAQYLKSLSNSLNKVSKVAPEYSGRCGELSRRFDDQARVLEDAADELDDPEPDDDDERMTEPAFDVVGLFSDL